MLTTGEDVLTGTAGNDTFNAPIVESNLADPTATLQSFDEINGGAGADTLKATLLDDVTVDSTSVETYELKGGDVAGLTVGVAADVTTLVNKMVGDTTINGAAALATITQNGDENLTVNGMKATTVSLSVADAGKTVAFNAAGTAKAAQTLDVSFNGDLTVTSGLTETLTVTANGAGTFDATDAADHDKFTLTNAGNVVTATIKGTGDIEVKLGTNTDKLTTFDASALVGGVDVDLAGAATSVLATVKGGQGDDDLAVTNLKDGGSIELGAGNDTLTTTGAKGAYTIDGGAGNDDITVQSVVVNKAAVVNGGDGDDIFTIDEAVINYYTATGTTLTVNGGAGNDTVIAGTLQDAVATVNFDGGAGDADVIRITDGLDITSAKRFSNFEVLDVTGATEAEAYDLSRELSLNAVLVNGATADAQLNNVQAGTSLEVRDGGKATIEYNLEDGTGDADAVSVLLTQDDSANKVEGATATEDLANTLDLTAEGIETVNINATAQVGTDTKGTTSTADDVAVAGSDYVNDVTLTSATVETITVSGNAHVTLDVTTADALTLIDASANTGGVEVDFSDNSTEITFLGGSGDDVVVANAEVAVIDAGVGADTITAGGMTTVVYGAAADSKLGLDEDGELDFTAMDTIETFVNYDVAEETGDRIDLTAFNFTGGRIEAVKQKGDISDLTALVANANNEGKDFFLDGTVDRAVVLASFNDDSYVFVDANKDGNFTAANDLVILVGTADLSVTDFMFQA